MHNARDEIHPLAKQACSGEDCRITPDCRVRPDRGFALVGLLTLMKPKCPVSAEGGLRWRNVPRGLQPAGSLSAPTKPLSGNPAHRPQAQHRTRTPEYAIYNRESTKAIARRNRIIWPEIPPAKPPETAAAPGRRSAPHRGRPPPAGQSTAAIR